MSRRHPVLQEVDELHGVVAQELEDTAWHSAVADSGGDAFAAMTIRVEASSSVPDRQSAVTSVPAVVSSRLELVQPWESEPYQHHTLLWVLETEGLHGDQGLRFCPSWFLGRIRF